MLTPLHRLVLFAVLPLLSLRAETGKLAAFEAGLKPSVPASNASATVEAEPRRATAEPVQEDSCEERAALGAALALSVLYGGMESLAAVAPDHWGVFEGLDFPRAPGSTLVPFARVDASYQSIDNNLDAVDVRGEVGFGPLGLQVRRTWYDEEGVDSGELQLTQVHALYRMQFMGALGVDFGVGPAVLDGQSRYEAVSWTVPFQLRLCPHLTLECRPMWVTFDESRVRDTELAAHLTWRNVGLRAGYRWLTNDDQSLEAPLIGISLRW
jgi:hypothetical protein